MWITNAPTDEASKASIHTIATKLGIGDIIATLLYNRGYQDSESARSFIRMENEILRNPFDMQDMMKGVERIKKALDNNE